MSAIETNESTPQQTGGESVADLCGGTIPVEQSLNQSLENATELVESVNERSAPETGASGSESGAAEPQPVESQAPAPRRAWYWRWVDNGPAVLAILFLVTGAFGLPLLYHSRAFSVRTKWVIGFVNVAYTLLSFYWAYVETMRFVTIIQAALAG